MWNSAVVSLACVLLGLQGSAGSLADELTHVTARCCQLGREHARMSPVCTPKLPSDVSAGLSTPCIFAMDGCCKEYLQKKQDCEEGVRVAAAGSCKLAPDTAKSCCLECLRGSKLAIKSRLTQRTEDECVVKNGVWDRVSEEDMSQEVFTRCCKNASNFQYEGVKTTTQTSISLSSDPVVPTKTNKDKLHSVCDDYAPTELCAHHCIPITDSYKCVCDAGFVLMADGRNCRQVRRNRCKPRNPCQQRCIDDGKRVRCSCKRGYRLMSDGKSCQDIDECALDPAVCLPDTQCYNLQGSYRCLTNSTDKGQCPPGYRDDIFNGVCSDINECQLLRPPCPAVLCENTVGGYRCGGVPGNPANLPTPPRASPAPPPESCPHGFTADEANGGRCTDIDECTMGTDTCDTATQVCINMWGTFHCQNRGSEKCPAGFEMNVHRQVCEDTDECADGAGTELCGEAQRCVNLPGAYDCRPLEELERQPEQCPVGMRKMPGNTVCEDIDECVEGLHLCDQFQNCLNTNGSYECICKLGFKPDSENDTCMDINECATGQHTCLPGSQRCDNTVGSFLCVRILSCGTGYILNHAIELCEDIDECALGTHDCAHAGPEYSCDNMPGSFRCVKQTPEYEYEYYDSEEDISKTNDTNINNSETKREQNTSEIVTVTPKQVIEPSKEITSPVPDVKDTQTTTQREATPTTPTTISAIINNENKRYNYILVTDDSSSDYHKSFKEDKPHILESNTTSTSTHVTVDSPKLDSTFFDNTINLPKQPDESFSYDPLFPPQPYEPNTPSTTSISPTTPYNPHAIPGIDLTTMTIESSVVDNVIETERPIIYETRDCQMGFERSEYGACFDVDECALNRHSCSGLTEICRNTMGGFECDCAPTFHRNLASGECELSSPPTTPAITTTHPSTTTTTTSTITKATSIASTSSVTAEDITVKITTLKPYRTTTARSTSFYPDYRYRTTRIFQRWDPCDAGYHLNTASGKCEDIDECNNGQARCAAVEVCVNTEGGYRCECPPNWRLDQNKHRCVYVYGAAAPFPPGYDNQHPYDHPSTPSVASTQLVNRGNAIPNFHHWTAECPWGYRLGYNNICEDVDECADGTAQCGPQQTCSNSPGGYTCACQRGLRLRADHDCEDVDECALAAAKGTPLCSQNADCVNTVGSYQCRCHQGFRTAPANDKVCLDINECDTDGGKLCDHRCNNVWGGYRCSCHRGYKLSADNRTCSDVDECTEYKHKVLCIGYCVNTAGSYKCECPRGYRLSDDNKSCIDINECETRLAPCGGGDVCINTRGTYHCQPVVCPPGYRLEDRHRCKRQVQCVAGDRECAHRPVSYSYHFITFVSNLYIPDGKVNLFTMVAPKLSDRTGKSTFQLRLVNVNAPSSVDKAEISAFVLSVHGREGVLSLSRALRGPQTVQLEMSMEMYVADKFEGVAVQFEGVAVARLYIYVSEHEF